MASSKNLCHQILSVMVERVWLTIVCLVVVSNWNVVYDG